MSMVPGAVSIRDVAIAQKIILYAILGTFGAYILAFAAQSSGIANPLFGLVFIGVVVVELYGCYRLTTGFGWNLGLVILCMVLMFVPCISLITLLVLNQKATTTLRAAGFKVGLLGVPSSEIP